MLQVQQLLLFLPNDPLSSAVTTVPIGLSNQSTTELRSTAPSYFWCKHFVCVLVCVGVLMCALMCNGVC